MYPPLKHFASPQFWIHYRRLPQTVRDLADKNFQLLKADSKHPSLHLKRVGDFWSVRVGLACRALGTPCEGGIVWFWIGSHADYGKLLSNE
jgi:hypothetical protein